MSAGIQADGIPNNLVRTSSGRPSRNSSRRSNPPNSPTRGSPGPSRQNGSKCKSKAEHQIPLVNTNCSKGSGKVNLGATTSGDLDEYEPGETDPLPTVREEINLCNYVTESKA